MVKLIKRKEMDQLTARDNSTLNPYTPPVARVAQILDPLYTVVVKLDKKYL